MMSDHVANPISLIKKRKIGRPEHSLTPHLSTFDNISFLPYPLPPPFSKWKSYVYHPLSALIIDEDLSLLFYIFTFFNHVLQVWSPKYTSKGLHKLELRLSILNRVETLGKV